MSESSLRLSGVKDIHSIGTEFVSKSYATGEKYYTPDKQINETVYHNEMDFGRYQNGERKQPDYIMIFREGGKIEHLDDIAQAYNDWGGELPIVVIDVDKCLASERQKVEDMLSRYHDNPEEELGKQIKQKIKNNRERLTTKDFCEDLQTEIDAIEISETISKNEEMEDQEELAKIDLKECEENYDLVTATDRKEAISDLKKLRMQIQEIMKGEEKENGQE